MTDQSIDSKTNATPNDTLMGKLTVEFIGTFFLVLTISMVVIKASDLSIVAPLAIGFTLTAMVYAFGPISGAHFNPAVTIGLYLTQRCPRAHVGPYIATECLGALCAAALALYMRGEAEAMIEAAPTAGFIAEAVWTFLLVFVILRITSKQVEGNQWFGIVVGFTVAGGAWVMGSESGAAFNPAVWLGLAVQGKLAWSGWLIYLIAPIVGAGFAVACNQLVEPTTIEPA